MDYPVIKLVVTYEREDGVSVVKTFKVQSGILEVLQTRDGTYALCVQLPSSIHPGYVLQEVVTCQDDSPMTLDSTPQTVVELPNADKSE